MNKTERQQLAEIVATMMFSFESAPEVVSAGKQISERFPCIAEELSLSRPYVAYVNILKCIRMAVHEFAEPITLASTFSDLQTSAFDMIEEVFDDFLYKLPNENPWLLELEGKLEQADSSDLWPVLGPILQSDQWVKSTRTFVDQGSKLFSYITCQKLQ